MTLKVRKDPAIKVDLAKWKGRLVLQIPDPEAAKLGKLEGLELKVIGYHAEPNFLSDGVLELTYGYAYRPPQGK